ncbi:pentapeptide repeat-containing protein [Nonomuraea sp. NPDC059023]|uniref:pentapeptide repeat-containing protein n=1 Tax=unclassified Nonomuraea TaxID=2593643 RepID=UPI0036AE23C0
MGFLRHSTPPAAPPALRTPRSLWWWALPSALLIGAAAWGAAQWLLQDLPRVPVPQQISLRIEALRTALAAAAGVGAGVTLLLAVRRQRHQEVASWHTTHDAAERRVTELYTKAVEQLGSAQAPVRLGGLYALERLAQDTPALRQTIVDVICAYLRMPYTIPADKEPEREREPGVPGVAIGGVAKPSPGPKHDPHEERQVRLTAQRILVAHLRHQNPPAHRWWQRRPADPNLHHWPGMGLDLRGATLIEFNLRNCRIQEAEFDGAIFSGDAWFEGATFNDRAGFEDAAFNDPAWFQGATFKSFARFQGATFRSLAKFEDATFSDGAWFDGATFNRAAWFEGVTFNGTAWFEGVTFNAVARFEGGTVSGNAWFDDSNFSGTAGFRGVTFSGSAGFKDVTVTGTAWFDDSTFCGTARFEGATFNRSPQFEGTTFNGAVRFKGAQGMEDAVLNRARLASGAKETMLPSSWRAEMFGEGWQTLRLATPEELAQTGEDAEG